MLFLFPPHALEGNGLTLLCVKEWHYKLFEPKKTQDTLVFRE
jgi:hypothetical protein